MLARLSKNFILGFCLFSLLFCGQSFAAEPSTANDYAKLASELMAQKQYEKAIFNLNNALTQFPNDAALWALKADSAYATGDMTIAVQSAEKSLSYDQTYAYPRLVLSRALLSQGQSDAAYSHIRQVIEKESDKGILHQAYVVEGEILHQQKKYKDAELSYIKAQDLEPAAAYINESRAWNMRFLNRINESEQQLKQGIAKQPDSARLYLALANLQKDRRDYHGSLQSLEQAFDHTDSSKAVQDPNSNYSPYFFSGTGMAGYSLDRARIPLAVRGTLERGFDFTNTENLLRAVGSGNIDSMDGTRLPTIQLSRALKSDGSVYIQSEAIPTTNIRWAYQNHDERNDSSIEHETVDLRLEPEFAGYFPILGDVTIFPYVKYLYLDSANISAADVLSNEQVKIDSWTGGIRFLSSPIFGKLYFVEELAYGYGDFRDSDRSYDEYRLGLTGVYHVNERLGVNAKLDIYYSDQSTDNQNFRYYWNVGADIKIKNNISLRLETDLIRHRDYIFNQQDVITDIYYPQATLRWQPFDRWRVEAKSGYWIGGGIHTYDFAEYKLELSREWALKTARSVGHHKDVSYTTPVLWYIGFSARQYTDLPETMEDTSAGVYTGIRLFY